ncbi:MAG: 50S ribosomal protein L35 [Candidatus Parcubacteria bacterium]|nr:50S ribosomal protein L35 [Candidatus Parcubacteria bacterium]
MKTHQSIAKRFKISKTGKLIKKKAGQDHFNAREKGSVTRAKRRNITTSKTVATPLKHLIPYSN